jgi:hypothetical protein
MDSDIALLISIVVIVTLILFFQIDIYRKILYIYDANTPEPVPSKEVRFSTSFLPESKKGIKRK